MAQIHAKESAYTNTKRRNLFFAVLFYGIAILIWLWWVHNIISDIMLPMKTAVFYLVVFAISGYIGGKFWHNYRKTLSGDQGIEHSLDLLKSLPDDYHVFSNIMVSGVCCNIVVVGTNGVFIINTKHHNGEITPTDDRKWFQKKVGRGGTHYSAKMRNPIKQLKKQIYELSQYLKSHDINVWVDGIVYFTNGDLILNGCSDKFTNKGDSVLSFILDYDVRQPLDNEIIKKINNLLG